MLSSPSSVLYAAEPGLDVGEFCRVLLESGLVVEGVDTTLPLHRWLLRQDDFQRGTFDTGWIERHWHARSDA